MSSLPDGPNSMAQTGGTGVQTFNGSTMPAATSQMNQTAGGTTQQSVVSVSLPFSRLVNHL